MLHVSVKFFIIFLNFRVFVIVQITFTVVMLLKFYIVKESLQEIYPKNQVAALPQIARYCRKEIRVTRKARGEMEARKNCGMHRARPFLRVQTFKRLRSCALKDFYGKFS